MKILLCFTATIVSIKNQIRLELYSESESLERPVSLDDGACSLGIELIVQQATDPAVEVAADNILASLSRYRGDITTSCSL